MSWRHDTHAALVEYGYLYRGATKCFYCKALVHFYKTPSGKSMPFDSIEKKLIPHAASCRARPPMAKILEFPIQREMEWK